MPLPATFGHYEVLQRDDGSLFELGRGAMGITYKAFDSNLRVPVALKVINETYLDSDIAKQRFVREARAAAKLRHRNVASVFHLGSEGSTMFYAMEFIDGETLDALIKRQGPLAPSLALQIVDQVARALNAALAHSLVHRDIKPANLMLVQEDDELAVKVIDFGLAKGALGTGEDAATLSVGGFVGTPHFASPEQLKEGDIDVRSDIYSLGVTLWYMLAGQTPFGGSMAQVMSQHLEKEPPFEKLQNINPPIAELLRRMLAKEPEDRPQTPVELRREIESCLESVGKSPDRDRAAFPPNAGLVTVPAAAPDSQFETGTNVAGRYRLEESLGDTNTGRLFRAEESATGRVVRLLLLHRELTGNAVSYTQVEREVERVVAVEHPNLLRVYGLETVNSSSFVTMEWVNGFSLLEVLRARRELGVAEVLRLLPQAADGIDYTLAAELTRLDLGLHHIFIHFEGPFARAALLRGPVAEWPAFSLKLNPLGMTRELSGAETYAGGHTVVGGGRRGAEETDARAHAIQSLAAVVYELLGGALPPTGSSTSLGSRYTPLASLSEQGNEALRQAFRQEPPYEKAYDFYQAIAESEGFDSTAPSYFAPPVRATASTSAGGRKPSASRAPAAPPPVPATVAPALPAKRPAPKPTPPPRSALPFLIFSVLALVIGGGAAIWFFVLPEFRKTEDPQDAPRPEDIETTPTHETAGPTPVPPPPQPTRQELLKVAVAEANDRETSEQWPEAIRAWTKITHDFSDFEVGKVRAEILIQGLLKRPDEVNVRELPALLAPITESAQADVLAAMKFLGKYLQSTDPATSFAWFSAAAARGDLESLTQKGLMLSNGDGCEKDLAKATECLREAAEKGHVTAIMLMGECYLTGKNVPQDFEKAAKLFQEAADKGNPIAMNKLGECYHKGLGVKRNYAEAARWFSEAGKNGNLESFGNLGALYMNGDGVARNEATAVDYFKKGIAGGDATSMFNFAKCLEFGRGAPQNAPQAEAWYMKSAAAGNEAAKAWCRQHGIDPKTH